jgi:hypothetical protein
MFRGLISTIVLIAIAGLGALVYVYGEVEPCRVLAAEYEMRGEDQGDFLAALRVLGFDTEKLYRMETSQYSTGECTRMLFTSWRQRFEG